MKKKNSVSAILRPLVCLCFVLLCSAKAPKHSVWFVVANASADKKPVEMKFSVSGRDENPALITEQEVQPGIQLFPEKKLKEGSYQLQVTAHNNLVEAKQIFTVDSDRWILVNYLREDSASIIKTYGYIDPAQFKKVDGYYVSVHMSVESRRPAGL